MKKILSVALILCLCLAMALPAFAAADGNVLRVQGTATISVTPDTAVLSVGYAGENADSTLAQEDTANAITAVIDALKALGIPEEDIVTSNLNTYPVYNYEENGQTLRGYRVEHMLSVTVRDLDKVGDTLDAALKAGANQSNSIDYRSSRENEVYLEALAHAFDNAAAKAEALAASAGVWLDSLAEVNEIAGYSTMRYGSQAKYEGAADASLGGTIMTGDLDVIATVELVYNTK